MLQAYVRRQHNESTKYCLKMEKGAGGRETLGKNGGDEFVHSTLYMHL
jgi:hypothetical protein